MKIKYLALVIVPALISIQGNAQFNDGSTAPKAPDQKAGAVPIPSADKKGGKPQVNNPPTSHRGNPAQPNNQNAAKAAQPKGGEKNYPNPEWKPTDNSAAKPAEGKTNYPDPSWKPTDQKGSAQAAKAQEKMGIAKDKAKNKMDQHAAEAQKALENAQQQINN